MLHTTTCCHIVFQPFTSSLVKQVQAEMSCRVNMELEDLTGFDDILLDLVSGSDDRVTGSAPLICERPVSLDDTLLYIHSSGSTGLPKSVPLNHRQIFSCFSQSKCYVTRETIPLT